MRAYISVDMEGIAGVSHAAPTQRGDSGYAAAVRLMDGEANAAIAGAFDGGATEVVVNDSHGSMFNLTPEAIDPRARLVQGRKPMSMVESADIGRYDVALFVGLPRPRGSSDGHHRPHVHRRPDADHAGRPPGRGVRHQRHVPRRAGRARGHGRRR